jgi:lysozyme
MNRERLAKQLEVDEGKKRFPYICTAGKLTIGIGRNLDAKGVSEKVIALMLEEDIDDAVADLDRELPWWRQLTDARQEVLVNMCFNMGIGNVSKGLLSFRNTLAALKRGDYEATAQGMEASKWAVQVGKRAQRLIKMMREG